MSIALPVDRLADWHTHSDLTDGTASPVSMADAAVRAGLHSWGLSDHVRADTAWLPEYVVLMGSIRRDGLDVRCGVEAKVLDSTGRLDLPARLPTLDYVLVADHQYPGAAGPVHPATVAAALAAGQTSAADVVAGLVGALCLGVAQAPVRPIVAHLFSLLPKLGLSESDVTDEHRHALAQACVSAGASVEVNQKWACPSGATLAFLAAAGVPLVAGSDAHTVDDVGRHGYLDGLDGVNSVIGADASSDPTGPEEPRAAVSGP